MIGETGFTDEFTEKLLPDSTRSCCFGLYPAKTPVSKPLPLQKVDIKTHIKTSVAKIKFSSTILMLSWQLNTFSLSLTTLASIPSRQPMKES